MNFSQRLAAMIVLAASTTGAWSAAVPLASFADLMVNPPDLQSVQMSIGDNLMLDDGVNIESVGLDGATWHLGFVADDGGNLAHVGWAMNMFNSVPGMEGRMVGKYSAALAFDEDSKPDGLFVVHDVLGDGIGVLDGGAWILGVDDVLYDQDDVLFGSRQIRGDVAQLPTWDAGNILPAMTISVVPDCSPGDTDGDGDIDTLDLTTAITNFTGAGGSGKTCADGDTDGDGDVDTGDLTFSIQNFTGAQAATPNVPDLVYDPATGNVTIDADGADVISFSLQSGPFSAADFSELPAGLTDNIATQIGWTSFNLFSGLTGTADLGNILPAGLDLAGLEAALTTASYGLALSGGGGGGRLDLIIPEPASIALLLASFGVVGPRRKRRSIRWAV